MYGQHDASWLSFAAYFARECGIADAAKLEPLARLAASAGWCWFFRGAAIITDRPERLCRDEQNRLHCEDGRAIKYRDGFGIYAWHGVRVPDHWIAAKDTLTAAEVLKEQNLEKRRAGCEILGWARILAELNAKTINTDDDPEIGTLVEVDLPADGSRKLKARFCRVRCGTGREFAICVPPTTKTALDAQAWMRGLSPNEFIAPEVRT